MQLYSNLSHFSLPSFLVSLTLFMFSIHSFSFFWISCMWQTLCLRPSVQCTGMSSILTAFQEPTDPYLGISVSSWMSKVGITLIVGKGQWKHRGKWAYFCPGVRKTISGGITPFGEFSGPMWDRGKRACKRKEQHMWKLEA